MIYYVEPSIPETKVQKLKYKIQGMISLSFTNDVNVLVTKEKYLKSMEMEGNKYERQKKLINLAKEFKIKIETIESFLLDEIKLTTKELENTKTFLKIEEVSSLYKPIYKEYKSIQELPFLYFNTPIGRSPFVKFEREEHKESGFCDFCCNYYKNYDEHIESTQHVNSASREFDNIQKIEFPKRIGVTRIKSHKKKIVGGIK